MNSELKNAIAQHLTNQGNPTEEGAIVKIVEMYKVYNVVVAGRRARFVSKAKVHVYFIKDKELVMKNINKRELKKQLKEQIKTLKTKGCPSHINLAIATIEEMETWIEKNKNYVPPKEIQEKEPEVKFKKSAEPILKAMEKTTSLHEFGKLAEQLSRTDLFSNWEFRFWSKNGECRVYCKDVSYATPKDRGYYLINLDGTIKEFRVLSNQSLPQLNIVIPSGMSPIEHSEKKHLDISSGAAQDSANLEQHLKDCLEFLKLDGKLKPGLDIEQTVNTYSKKINATDSGKIWKVRAGEVYDWLGGSNNKCVNLAFLERTAREADIKFANLVKAHDKRDETTKKLDAMYGRGNWDKWDYEDEEG